MQIFANKIFNNPIEIIKAFDNESFVEGFSRIEKLRKSHYLLGYIRYEAKDVFLGKQIKSDLPLLYFEAYTPSQKTKNLSHCKKIQSSDAAIQKITPMIEFKDYSSAITQIKEEIAQGNTYELNYTYDWEIKSNLEGLDLFNSILPRQTTPYNAYIKNDYEEILSFSPELFFELENNKIRTKPMKGTIARGQNKQEDLANIEFLKNDEKNKAENVMIVDLLRNDLGKIAKTGTVKVDKLFEVETHETLHQMTSEISAELEENITLFEIFNAIFPCGSITGAPKISTMEIINKLEIGLRGIYCGAIGLITPEKTVFSVPIRILHKTNKDKNFICRVGGAIVWDSTAQEEWEETLTKIKFLKINSEVGRALLPDSAQLVETMLVKNGEIQDFDEHLARMDNSAQKLGFDFNKQKAYESCVIERRGKDPTRQSNGKILRLLLNKNGIFETQILTLDVIKTNKVTISKTPIQSNENLLYHKTTHRPWYEDSMKRIKSGEIFDEIFFNERGELTEGARSNIILQLDGEFFTPPVECGLLNGIVRQCLLPRHYGERVGVRGLIPTIIKEKVLYLKDLEKAEKVFCINSLRGIMEVDIDFNR